MLIIVFSKIHVLSKTRILFNYSTTRYFYQVIISMTTSRNESPIYLITKKKHLA